jgi:hypothetical protein
MADPALWAPLKDSVVSVLKDALKDFVDVEKSKVKDLLAEVAEEAAKQSWLLVNGTDDEKAQAIGNLRSLKAQVIIDVADAEIVAAHEMRATFIKIVETVGLFLLQNAPKLLMAI